MLTLNSKALKIGNKWLNPINGSGPVPPATYKSYVYREYITKTADSPAAYDSSIQNLKFDGSFPNVTHINFMIDGSIVSGDSSITDFISGSNIDLRTVTSTAPAIGDYIEVQFTMNDPSTGTVTTTSGCQGFLYGIDEYDNEILLSVTLGTGSAQSFDPNIVNAPEAFDYYILRWYYERNDGGQMQIQKLKFDNVIMIPEYARCYQNGEYWDISQADIEKYMEGDTLTAYNTAGTIGFAEMKFQAPSNFESINITTWDWRVAGTIYGVMNDGYSAVIAQWHESEPVGAKELTFSKAKPTYTYNVTTAAVNGSLLCLPSGGSASDVLKLSYMPDTGYGFMNYTVSGATVSDQNLTLGSSNVTVTANFGLIYNVTTSGNHGTVTASPDHGPQGTNVALSNTPDSGYDFDSYTITGTGATLSGSTLTIGTSDVTVVGNFTQPSTFDSFELELTSNGNGMSFGKVSMTPTAGTWTNPNGTFTLDSSNLTYMKNNVTSFPPSAAMTKFNLTFAGGTKPASISWDNSVNSSYTCTGATFYGYINNVKYTLGTLAGYPELLAMTHTITL